MTELDVSKTGQILGINKKTTDIATLNLFPGHEGIYHLRDINYIIRIIRKIAKSLPNKKGDIDWLQVSIESFLVLNSRFYEDLIVDVVKGVRKYSVIPESFTVRDVLSKYKDSVSSMYHKEKMHNRNRAAHGSNYQRIGIPEFKNDILARPLRFESKQKLANMASRKDLIKMWQKDMFQSADDIECIFKELVGELNNLEPVEKLNA